MTLKPGQRKRNTFLTYGLFFAGCAVGVMTIMASSVSWADSGNSVTGVMNGEGSEVVPTNVDTKTTNNRTPGYGIDPATDCTDVNGNGQISPDECGGRNWDSTNFQGLAPYTVPKQGENLPAGSSNSTLKQNSDQVIKSGPHFTMHNYNKPSVSNSTATAGMTSTPNGSLRDMHNEYGFDIVVDKKTDPLEPYYQRFQENYAVDAQQDANGDMVGQSGTTYEKIVTEENPTNPGVFNRYTVTGTATSNGSSGNYSSQCQTGCPTDTGGAPVDPETGWSHPWQ